jgi:phage/plasmid primase-like uncharacterized protein
MLSQLISALNNAGLKADSVIPDSQIHRVKVAGKKGLPGWYVAKEFNGKLFASFGDWSTQQKYTFKNGQEDACNLSAEELITLSTLAEQERQEFERRQQKAAEISLKVWQEAGPVPLDHPYLINKGISPHEARFEAKTGAILIDLIDRNGNHVSIQRIKDKSQLQSEDEPSKRLFKYGQKKGCCHVIEGNADKIFICEGFATGATINELTGFKVLVAVDSGNILYVARITREKYPDWKNPKPIIIAADNDHKKKVNVGLEKAREAAEEIGAEVIFPEGIEGTDWNDHCAEKGPEATRAALLQEKPRVKSLTAQEIMETVYPPIKWAVEGIIPEGLTIIAGRPKFGKSWMMLGLCYAVANGLPAWDYGRTKKGSVYGLFLEDSYRRIQDRMKSMEGYFDTFPPNLHIFTDFPRIGSGFIRELERLIKADKNTGVVIVDTLQKVRPKSAGGKRNLYQAEYEDFERLQKVAIYYGIPIIAIHHTRKGGHGKESNPMDEMSGSTGIQGVADTLIVCSRDGDKGKMYVTGREVNEEEYPMQFNKRNMTWKVFNPDAKQIEIGGLLLNEWFEKNCEICAAELAELENINLRRAQEKLSAAEAEGKLRLSRLEGRKKFYSPTEIF